MSVIIWIHLDQIVRQDNSSSSVIINVKTWLLKCAQMWRYCILWGRKHQIKVKNLSDHIPNKLSLNEIWTNIRPLSVNDPVSVLSHHQGEIFSTHTTNPHLEWIPNCVWALRQEKLRHSVGNVLTLYDCVSFCVVTSRLALCHHCMNVCGWVNVDM